MTMPMMPRVRAVVSLEEEDAAAWVSLALRGGVGGLVVVALLRVVGLLGVVGRAATVVVVGGGGELQDRGGAVGLLAALGGLLDERTTSLLSYVWIALKTSSSASSGSAPTETGNCWK
ncbi:hypothetical protein SALBM217S_00759 [Streptomyces griseoloalbus]